MPRNEFMDHEEEESPDFDLVIVRDAKGFPIDIVKAPRNNHPGKGEHEDLSQEVPPLEEDPHMWPAEARPTLADLRRAPGATTTEAHIAEFKVTENTTED